MKKIIVILLLLGIVETQTRVTLEVPYPRTTEEDEQLAKEKEIKNRYLNTYKIIANRKDFMEFYPHITTTELEILQSHKEEEKDFDFNINENDKEELKNFNFEETKNLHKALQIIMPYNNQSKNFLIGSALEKHKINWEDTKQNARKNSYFKKRPQLLKLTIFLMEKLNEGILNNIHFKDDNFFSACPCIQAPERIFMALLTLIKTLKTFNSKNSLTYVSLGSGYLLQDSIILHGLLKLDYTIHEIVLIEPSQDPLPLAYKLKQQINPTLGIKYPYYQHHYKPQAGNYLLIMADPDTDNIPFKKMMSDFQELTDKIPGPTTLIKSIMYNSETKKLVTFDIETITKEDFSETPIKTAYEPIQPPDLSNREAKPLEPLHLKSLDEIKELFEKYQNGETTLENITAAEENPLNKIRINTLFKRWEKQGSTAK